MTITVIANNRGLVMATRVGVVEKIITFFFLFPSAFMVAISALVAQNIGAAKFDRARSMLRYSLIITILFGDGMLCIDYTESACFTVYG